MVRLFFDKDLQYDGVKIVAALEAVTKPSYISAWITEAVLCLNYNSKCQTLQEANRDSLAQQPWH